MNTELNSIKIPRLVSHLQTLLCSENMRRTDLTASLKFSNRLSKFSMIFTEKRHRRHPQRPYDVSRGQNRYVTLSLFKEPPNIVSN